MGKRVDEWVGEGIVCGSYMAERGDGDFRGDNPFSSRIQPPPIDKVYTRIAWKCDFLVVYLRQIIKNMKKLTGLEMIMLASMVIVGTGVLWFIMFLIALVG